MNTLAFGLGSLGTMDMIVILLLALLLFGKRLPEVGKSLGKGITEFKKGLKGIEQDVEEADQQPKRELPSEKPYRPPLSDGGEERRVSRSDKVEEKPETSKTAD